MDKQSQQQHKPIAPLPSPTTRISIAPALNNPPPTPVIVSGPTPSNQITSNRPMVSNIPIANTSPSLLQPSALHHHQQQLAQSAPPPPPPQVQSQSMQSKQQQQQPNTNLSTNLLSSNENMTTPSTPLLKNQSITGINIKAIQPNANVSNANAVADPVGSQHKQILTKARLQELVLEVDPLQQLDEDVEEHLLQLADDFIENVVCGSSSLAKHRNSNTLEVKDVMLHLEHKWKMWIPGMGCDEIRPYKKLIATETHKQRMNLIKKAMSHGKK